MSTGFQLGPIYIHYYGIILMTGAVAAAWLADWSARRRVLKSDVVWDALIWVLIGGIIGARLWHIFTPPPSMLIDGANPYFYEIQLHVWDNLWAMINTRRGGLGIPGAVIGGMLARYLFCRRKKLSFLMWADIAVPALALGQAIGRWGNFVNQELYGKPTDLPWAISIDPLYRVAGYEQYATFHPLFLYESLWNLFMLGLLLWRAMEQVAKESRDGTSPAYLRSSLQRRWDIEDIKSLQAREIEIKKAANGFVMRAWYRAEAPFLANVSLVVDFDKSVDVRQ